LRPFDALLAEQPDLSLAQRIAREYAAMKRVLSEALLIEDDSPTCPDFFDIVSRLQLREVAHTFAEAVRTQYLSSDLDAPRCSIIFEIMQYIKENLASDVTLGSIAEHFAYHPNYVSTLFKRETNRNVSDYILDLRMERTKELLVNRRLSIRQVSQQVGYANSRYFGVVFKRKTGLTPMAYREQL